MNDQDASSQTATQDTLRELRSELKRLHRMEQCVWYLINSNAWIGDTDGIEANLTELKELLVVERKSANSTSESTTTDKTIMAA